MEWRGVAMHECLSITSNENLAASSKNRLPAPPEKQAGLSAQLVILKTQSKIKYSIELRSQSSEHSHVPQLSND
jgi:hypothetical protein